MEDLADVETRGSRSISSSAIELWLGLRSMGGIVDGCVCMIDVRRRLSSLARPFRDPVTEITLSLRGNVDVEDRLAVCMPMFVGLLFGFF